MDEAYKILLEQSRLIVFMAGMLMTGLIGVVGFLVGWQVRQDKRASDQGEKIARVEAQTTEHAWKLNNSIPELFQKWDRLVAERCKKE